MSTQSKESVRYPLRKYSMILAGAFLLYILLVYLNTIFSSNIIFAGTMLMEITDVLYLAVEQVTFFILYAYAIHYIFYGGVREGLRYALVYAIATTVRHLLLHVMFRIGKADWEFQLFITLANILLELAEYALVFLISYFLVRRFDRTMSVIQKGNAALGRNPVDREAMVYPSHTLPLKSDPVRLSTLLTAALISGIRIVGRVIYDIGVGPAVDLTDAMWMVAYYTTDVLIGVGGYFLMLYLLRLLKAEATK